MKKNISMNKQKYFASGDLVTINMGVHDEDMTDDRTGLVVETVGERRDQHIVMFSNGKFLKFHKSQLTLLVKV